MLDELRHITSSEPYLSGGGMKIKEISVLPSGTPNARLEIEIWIDDFNSLVTQTWELTCNGLGTLNGVPQYVIPRSQLRLYDDHPLLWDDREIYFTVTSKADSIPALMGDLFIEHTNACGNWVDFHWLYDGLQDTLQSLRENQLAIPSRLQTACFPILERHGVQYRINASETNHEGYQVLLFSNPKTWPDYENFRQSYIIAKEFSERRIS
jgi:hypothetical protein